ncbi:hypothetical protein [Streptomyces erythrochromogenes]|uniref:hypothetical protein n=1 Tax=Streptomyces erythrochromogenes TaxID=285574 RepID=UPI003688FE17
MTTISAGAIDRVTKEARAYHHPHFTGASAGQFGRLVFDFRPFTGAEQEPLRPIDAWRDESLAPDALAFIDAQYDEASRLWREAACVAALKQATNGAASLWDTYSRARADMDQLFTSLDSKPDTHWRAAVSQLVAAQNKALDAAVTWDRKGLEIATVHEGYHYVELSRADVYEAASVDPSEWVVGDFYDYQSFRRGPLARDLQQHIAAQREHLRTVAALSGDPHQA